MVPNLVGVYQNHSQQKKSLQNSTRNLSIEIYLQIFILYDVFIQHKYTSYVQVCKCWLDFFIKIKYFKLKLMQIFEMSKNK